MLLISVSLAWSANSVFDVPQAARATGYSTFLAEIGDEAEYRRDWGIEAGDSIRLAEPYTVFFMTHEEVLSFADSEPGSDVFSFGRPRCYAFPVVAGDEWIETHRIFRNLHENGTKIIEDRPTYFYQSSSFGGKEDPVLKLRKEYPTEQGYSILNLRMLTWASYYLIRSPGGEIQGIDRRQIPDWGISDIMLSTDESMRAMRESALKYKNTCESMTEEDTYKQRSN